MRPCNKGREATAMKEKKLKKKLTEFAELIKSELSDTYDLVYVDYDQEFTPEQVNILLTEEYPWEHLDDLMEWESDSLWHGVKYVLDELVKDISRREDTHPDVLDAFEVSSEKEEIEDMIRDRDSGDWFNTMAAHSSTPIMRIPLDVVLETGRVYEDSLEWYTSDAEKFRTEWIDALTRIGLDPEENAKPLDDLFAELYIPDYYTGFLVFRPTNLAEIITAAQREDVLEVTDPHIWITNPIQGNGWMEQFKGTVKVKVSDLSTDSSAWGYGVEDVFSIYPPAVDAETKIIPSKDVV